MLVITISVTSLTITYRTIIHARYVYQCNNFIIIYRTINHARYSYQCNQLYHYLRTNQPRPL